MSRDILDLIDNAIAGATSEDAMRWTPDAEEVTETTAGAFTEADVARIFDVPVNLIQGTPRLPGFRSPMWCEVWKDPHTQRVWIAPLGTPQPVGPIEDNPVWVEVDSLAQPAIDLATTASVSLADSLSSFLRHAGASTTPAIETMRRAGMVTEQPPQDPMARALWLRQHRNTGPAARSRTPRRIDPRRAR